MSKPVGDVDLGMEKSADSHRRFPWRHKWGVRSNRRAVGVSKVGGKWETKREKKRHLLKYSQALRNIL